MARKEFNWEEFLSNDKIAVHCSTEEQAIDFCRRMHEHGLTWNSGESYLKNTNWDRYGKKQCYTSYGAYSSLGYYTGNNYTILEWSDYEKEKDMNLELNNLTEEQKKQIIELAKKFEQENEIDKLDYGKDYIVFNGSLELPRRMKLTECEFKDQFFDLGLTAHTKEEAEKIRRRLLVEKELRNWAKKCKESVDWESKQAKYCIGYDNNTKEIILDDFCDYTNGNIIFTDNEIGRKAIESIGQERLIRDYFGIDNQEKKNYTRVRHKVTPFLFFQ